MFITIVHLNDNIPQYRYKRFDSVPMQKVLSAINVTKKMRRRHSPQIPKWCDKFQHMLMQQASMMALERASNGSIREN
jgi:hypothetical protein